MRGDVTARAGTVTVSHISLASKPHVCGYCGGTIQAGDQYIREESVPAKALVPDSDTNFWRKWGRIPHEQKEIGVFHKDEVTCQDWLEINSEPGGYADTPQVERLFDAGC